MTEQGDRRPEWPRRLRDLVLVLPDQPSDAHRQEAWTLILSGLTRYLELHASRGTPRDVLPQQAEHVGSEACHSCHSAEFATWSSGRHAHAGDTLTEADKAADSDCLACHTTGFDRSGGFPPSAVLADQPDLGRVGCESCHGPGGDHIEPDSQKIGSIVSLGDKCDSCVIEHRKFSAYPVRSAVRQL